MDRVKSRKAMALLFVSSVFFVYSGEFIPLKTIEWSNIEQYSKKIDSLVNRHRMIALSITGLLLASQALQLFAVYQHYTATPTLVQDVGINKQSLNAEIKERISLGLAGLKEGLYGLPATITTSITTGSFVWPTLNLIKEFGIYCGIHGVADLFLESVHHRDDINWYMRHYAPFINTVGIIQEQINRLINPEQPLSDAQRKRSMSVLYNTVNDLGQELIELLAFMEHKKSQLTPDVQRKVTVIIDFIMHYSNDWIVTINDLLLHEQYSSIETLMELQSAVVRIKNEVTLHGKQFATYEKQLRKTSLWNHLLH